MGTNAMPCLGRVFSIDLFTKVVNNSYRKVIRQALWVPIWASEQVDRWKSEQAGKKEGRVDVIPLPLSLPLSNPNISFVPHHFPRKERYKINNNKETQSIISTMQHLTEVIKGILNIEL